MMIHDDFESDVAEWNGCPLSPPQAMVSIGPSGIGAYCQHELCDGLVSVRSVPNDDGDGYITTFRVEVEGPSIPAAIGEVVERVRWGVGVVEAFCAGVALGLVGLTFALWLVM